MKLIPNLTNYIKNDYQKIIEAVVTNNVGYEPVGDWGFSEKYGGKFVFLDGTETSDTNYMNLHSQLKILENKRVLSWFDEYDRRLPLFTRFDFDLIDMN